MNRAARNLAGLLVPSKLYGLLAAGVPVLYVGPPSGRAHEVAGAGGAGVSLRNGDGAALASAIRSLRDDPALAAAIGKRGRDLYEARFERARSLERHHRLLRRVTGIVDDRTAVEAPC